MERETDTPEHPIIIIIIFFSFKNYLICDYPAQDFAHMKSGKASFNSFEWINWVIL